MIEFISSLATQAGQFFSSYVSNLLLNDTIIIIEVTRKHREASMVLMKLITCQLALLGDEKKAIDALLIENDDT
jgi:hypothetical protein